jgi:hypothetical protein
MEIEQKVKNWFDETMVLLESRFSKCSIANDLEDVVNSSVSLVLKYALSMFDILEQKRNLPAMALLRVLYQLISRVTWILMGTDDSVRQSRLERLEKTSLKDQLKLINEILDAFKDDKRETTINVLSEYDRSRKEIEQRIKELNTRNVKEILQPSQILKEVFENIYDQPNGELGASKLIPIKDWLYLHRAIHPDYIILKSAISDSTGCTLYEGDVNENTDMIRYECCVCIHRFLKEIYGFYKFNFKKIDNEFFELSTLMSNKI